MSTQRDQFGIVFDSLGMSQILTEFIFSIPDDLSQLNHDLCVFYSRVSPLYITVPCPLLTTINLTKYNGTLITTSLENTKLALDVKYNTNKIYYYVYNLEWTYNEHLFELARKVITDDRIVVITRTKEYANKIEEDFGIKGLFVINTCNFPAIVKGILNAESSKQA